MQIHWLDFEKICDGNVITRWKFKMAVGLVVHAFLLIFCGTMQKRLFDFRVLQKIRC